MPADQLPAAGAADPGPDEEPLDQVFWSVARRLRRRTRETVSPFGITPGQARALGQLARNGAMRPSTLSEGLRIVPRSGTEVVDSLEERGLVQRSPDPDDRRATLVALTPLGRRTAADVQAAQQAEAEAFFGTLAAGEREALRRILRELRGPEGA